MSVTMDGEFAPNGGRHGPFEYNGNYYLLTRNSTNVYTLQVEKSSDGTANNFSTVDTDVYTTTSTLYSIDAVQVGSTLYIAVCSEDSTTAYYRYFTFNMSTDVLSSPQEIAVIGTNPPATADMYVCLAVRSDGSVIAAYQGATNKVHGTTYNYVFYKKRSTGGTWGSETEVDDGGTVNYIVDCCVLGASDLVHIVYSHTHKSLNSSDSLSSAEDLADSTSGTDRVRGAWYNDGTNNVAMFIWRRSSDTALVYSTVVDDGTPTAETVLYSSAIYQSGNLEFSIVAENNGDSTSKFEAVFIDLTTQDIYYSEYTGSWSTASVIEASITATAVAGTGLYTNDNGDFVLGFLYTDSSHYYDEKILVAAGGANLTADISLTVEPVYDATVVRKLSAAFSLTAEPAYTATVVRQLSTAFNLTAEPAYDAMVIDPISAAIILTAEPAYAAMLIRQLNIAFDLTAEPIYDATVIRSILIDFTLNSEPQYAATTIDLIAVTIDLNTEPVYDATVVRQLVVDFILSPEPQYDGTTIGQLSAAISLTAEPAYAATTIDPISAAIVLSPEPQYDGMTANTLGAAIVLSPEPQYAASAAVLISAAFVLSPEPQYESGFPLAFISNLGSIYHELSGNQMGPFWYAGRLHVAIWHAVFAGLIVLRSDANGDNWAEAFGFYSPAQFNQFYYGFAILNENYLIFIYTYKSTGGYIYTIARRANLDIPAWGTESLNINTNVFTNGGVFFGSAAVYPGDADRLLMSGREADYSGSSDFIRYRLAYTTDWTNDGDTSKHLGSTGSNSNVNIGPNNMVLSVDGTYWYIFLSQNGDIYYHTSIGTLLAAPTLLTGTGSIDSVGSPEKSAILGTFSYYNGAVAVVVCIYLNSSGGISSIVFEDDVLNDNFDIASSVNIVGDTIAAASTVYNDIAYCLIVSSATLTLYKQNSDYSWSALESWNVDPNLAAWSFNGFSRTGYYYLGIIASSGWLQIAASPGVLYTEYVLGVAPWAEIILAFDLTAEPDYVASVIRQLSADFILNPEPSYDAVAINPIYADIALYPEPQYTATVIRQLTIDFTLNPEPQYTAIVIRLVLESFILNPEPQYIATVIRLLIYDFALSPEPQYTAIVIRQLTVDFALSPEPQYTATVIRSVTIAIDLTAEPVYSATVIVEIIVDFVLTAEPAYAAITPLNLAADFILTAEPQYDGQVPPNIEVTISLIAEPAYAATVPPDVYIDFALTPEPQYEATVPASLYFAFTLYPEPQYDATMLFELIQSYPQFVRRYLAIAPRNIVYQARTTGELIQDSISGGIVGIYFDTPSGTATQADVNMSVDIGTSQGGREINTVRLRQTIDTSNNIIYVNEISYGDLPIVEDLYITVRDEFLPNQRLLRLVAKKSAGSKYADDFTEYHDYNDYYSNQNSQPQAIVIAEGQFDGYPVEHAGWVDETGYREVYIDISKTYFPKAGQSVNTYIWDYKDQFNVEDISDTRKRVIFPPGFRYVKITAISNAGTISYRRIPIWVFDSSYLPLTDHANLGFKVDTDDTEIGRNMSFTLFGDPGQADDTIIPEGSLVCYFEEAYFGQEHLREPFNYRKQFLGWAIEDSIEVKRTGSYKLSVGGMATWLDKIGGFGLQLNFDSSPHEWYELPKLNPDIVMAYILRQFTTVLELCNLYPFFPDAVWPDAPIQKEAITPGSIWAQLTNLAPAYDMGQIGCTSVGDIYLTFHPSYPSTIVERPGTGYTFKLIADDLADANPIAVTSYKLSRSVGRVDITGARWNGQESAVPKVMRSLAPGEVQGKSSGSDNPPFQRLRGITNKEAQQRLNEISGHQYARKNDTQSNLTINLIGNYDVFEPARGDLIQLLIDDVSNLRNYSFDPEAYYKVTKVSIAHNNQRGAKQKALSLGVERVTSGLPGITKAIPVNENEVNPYDDNYWVNNPAVQYPQPTPVQQIFEDVEAQCVSVLGEDALTEILACYAIAWDRYSNDIADTASFAEEDVQWRSIAPLVPNYDLIDCALYRPNADHLVVRALYRTDTALKIYYCDNTLVEEPNWTEEIKVQLTGVQPSQFAIAASRNQDRWGIAWAAKDGVRAYIFDGSTWNGPILMGSDAYNDYDVTSSGRGFDICILNNRLIAPGAVADRQYKLYVIQEGETTAVELPNSPTFNSLVHCLEPASTYGFYAAAQGGTSDFYYFSESTNPTVDDLTLITGDDIPGFKNALAIDKLNDQHLYWVTELSESDLRDQITGKLFKSTDALVSIDSELDTKSYAAVWAYNGIIIAGGGSQMELSVDAASSFIDRLGNLLNGFSNDTQAIVSGCALLPPVEAAPPDEDPIGAGGPDYTVDFDSGYSNYTILDSAGGAASHEIIAEGNPDNALKASLNAAGAVLLIIDINSIQTVNRLTFDIKCDGNASILSVTSYIRDTYSTSFFTWQTSQELCTGTKLGFSDNNWHHYDSDDGGDFNNVTNLPQSGRYIGIYLTIQGTSYPEHQWIDNIEIYLG